MESEGMNLLINSTVLFAVFAGACVLLLMYIIKLLNADQKNVDDKPKNEKLLEQTEKKKDSGASGKSKKKGSEGRWTGRTDKQGFTHPWLLTSLKGHTSQVLDMDFSSNGKYLASCGEEDPDPGGDLGLDGGNSSSSNSDCNRENSLPSSANPSPRTKGLSRRQRKNRRREDPSPPENKKKSKTKRPEPPASTRKPIDAAPLKHFLKLNLAEPGLARFLGSYLLSPEQMLTSGYPVESECYPGRAIIFKGTMSVPTYYSQNNYRCAKINVSESRFDVNAQEFVPGMDYAEIKAEWNANHDSGQGSGSSSDSGEVVDDSESSTSIECYVEPRNVDKNKTYLEKDRNREKGRNEDTLININKSYNEAFDDAASNTADVNKFIVNNQGFYNVEEHTCVRCGNGFFLTSDYKYVTQERCVYHWGKLQNSIAPAGKYNKTYGYITEYTCCRGKPGSRGCTSCKLHVWNGVEPGFNGPYNCYMYTRRRKTPPPDGNFGVYALDCEMCYTVAGLELTKVTVVGADGRLVYDSFVKPEHKIIDYNTRFSGITAKDLSKKSVVKTLREVQNDLMGFINANTILIGHGLENDLRALRIMHYTIVDTAVVFPHTRGLPFRRSLKSLTSCYLRRDIQCGTNGHNSYEDARACMEIMLWRVHKEFRSLLEHLEH